MSNSQSKILGRLNVVKVVGATSSKGFLVDLCLNVMSNPLKFRSASFNDIVQNKLTAKETPLKNTDICMQCSSQSLKALFPV